MNFEEQILSRVIYPNIFLRQMEAMEFIILQIFCEVLKNATLQNSIYSFLRFSNKNVNK